MNLNRFQLPPLRGPADDDPANFCRAEGCGELLTMTEQEDGMCKRCAACAIDEALSKSLAEAARLREALRQTVYHLELGAEWIALRDARRALRE